MELVINENLEAFKANKDMKSNKCWKQQQQQKKKEIT